MECSDTMSGIESAKEVWIETSWTADHEEFNNSIGNTLSQ